MTRISQLSTGVLALFLAAGSLTCGGVTPPVGAGSLEMASGNNQTAPTGQPLPNPLVVSVTDDNGDPLAGVSVSWSAQGGGSVSAATVTTGSDGRAAVTRVLGPTAGAQGTTASAAGLTGSPVTFVSTAGDGGGESTIAISTNPPVEALTDEVFDPLAQPEVIVKDGSGNPVGGVEVTATLASGGGSLKGKATSTTNASGVAKFGDLGIEGIGEHTLEFTAGTATVTSSPVMLKVLPPEATSGEWGPVVPWDIVPLHMTLLPTGKIFVWGKREAAGETDTIGKPRIWDPSSGPPSGAAQIAVADMLFCAGHTLMPDGRLMVSGGHYQDDAGIKTTYFFSADGVKQQGPDMANGRWYPTVTVLEDGRMLTMAGQNEASNVVTTPEIWEGGAWQALPGAGALEIPYYPRNFVDPKNGLIFYASERIQSRWFNVDGTGVGGGRGSWTSGPSHIFGFNREYGSAVMYDVGKILVVGGGGHTNWSSPDPKTGTPTATAEVIDLNQTSPSWQSTGSMANRRRHMNATILPDGQVLATGGTRGGGFVDITEGNAVKAAELWDPTTGQWTTLASNSIMRVYHSVSLLLPDGSVLHGASGDAMVSPTVPVPPERNHEIFQPPYFFKGARPTITSVSSSTVGYGETFSVATPNAAQITEVRWIRLGSVTHAFDAGQAANKLSFEIDGGNVNVTAPLLPRQAPPGHYLVFLLNRNGVPSTGKIIRVQ